MNKYQNGKIYKIVCRVTNLVYIGSTTQKYLSNRLKGHVYTFNKKTGNVTSFKILESGDYYIELVELYPCNSKDELLVRERYYFDVIDCVNKRRPKVTLVEQKEERKEQYQINKEKIKEVQKEQYQINKEKIKEVQKKYRQNNEVKIALQKKEYYKLKKGIKKELDFTNEEI